MKHHVRLEIWTEADGQFGSSATLAAALTSKEEFVFAVTPAAGDRFIPGSLGEVSLGLHPVVAFIEHWPGVPSKPRKDWDDGQGSGTVVAKIELLQLSDSTLNAFKDEPWWAVQDFREQAKY